MLNLVNIVFFYFSHANILYWAPKENSRAVNRKAPGVVPRVG